MRAHMVPACARDYLRTLAVKLDACSHSERGPLVAAAAAHLGCSAVTIYARLKREVGWDPGRKTRSDKGATCVDADTLDTLGAMQRLGMRENGKQVLFVPTAASVAVASGIEIPVSNGHLSKLMRARRLDPKSQRAEKPVQHLAAPHPNHTHQMDPSLCLLYYSKGRQHVVRDDVFYKNKLARAEPLLKMWRYVCYDRASGVVQFRYYEAAGENQETGFDFLAWAWGKKPGITAHGVPKNLLWDKGSSNTSYGIARVLESLEVTPLTHAPGAPRVKGGVENGNNLVETHFESRLRLEPVDGIEALNAAAIEWQEAFNANRIPREDTRIRREGIDPIARYDLWNLIREEELRLLPDVEVLRGFMTGAEQTRKVRPDLSISYRHPRGERPDAYDLAGLDGICVGDEVTVRPLVFGKRAITVTVARYDGAPLTYRREPTREYDVFGNIAGAPVISEEFHGVKHTAIENAAKRMDAAAWPDAKSAEEIRRSREKGGTPFGGELKAISSLAEIERVDYVPKRGTPIALRGPVVAPQREPLHVTVRRLRAEGIDLPAIGDRVCALYPEGVGPEDYPALVAALRGEAPGLKVISG